MKRWIPLCLSLLAFALGDVQGNASLSAAQLSDWPQWRGPHRDGKSPETGLLQQWPEGGPTLLWTCREVGRGFSGPAVVQDSLYTLGFVEDKESAIKIDLQTGKVQWITSIGDFYENAWGGGPRTTPTVDGKRVYALAGQGNLTCLDSGTGEIVWKKNLVDDFGGKIPNWGYSESPLVDGQKVVVKPGGKKCVVALNKNDGELIWATQGLDDQAAYASFVKTVAHGVPLYISMTSGGVVAVHAETGQLQFQYPKTANRVAVIPTPIIEEELVYSTSGYGTGCGLVKLIPGDKQQSVNFEEVYFNKGMQNHHGGVILHKGYIYGYSNSGGWSCQEFQTGEMKWRRGKLPKGSLIYADNRLYCYSKNDGTCALVEPTPKAWTEHGRLTIPEETKLERGRGAIWTHPVVAQGKLFLRDQDLLFCYDISAPK